MAPVSRRSSPRLLGPPPPTRSTSRPRPDRRWRSAVRPPPAPAGPRAGRPGGPGRRRSPGSWWPPPSKPGPRVLGPVRRPGRPPRPPWPCGGRRRRRAGPWVSRHPVPRRATTRSSPSDLGRGPEGPDQGHGGGQPVRSPSPAARPRPGTRWSRRPRRRPPPAPAPRRGRGSRPRRPPSPASAPGADDEVGRAVGPEAPRLDVGPHAREHLHEAQAGRPRRTRCVTSTSLPGTTHPATTQKAAWEGSPGTRGAGAGASSAAPGPRRSPARASTSMSAPARASISSVWARVATGSRTTVSPSASSPASRMADFTWALATGGSSDARQRPAGDRSGGRQRSPVRPRPGPHGRQRAGDAVHGPRRERLVPHQPAVKGRPATTPASSRSPVPELPQSSGAPGPRAGGPGPAVGTSDLAVGLHDHGPEGGHRGQGVGTSSRRTGRGCTEVPSARAPRSRARWDTDLSPGVRTVRRLTPAAMIRRARQPSRLAVRRRAVGSRELSTVARCPWSVTASVQGGRLGRRPPPAPGRPGGPRPSGRSRCRRC